MRKEKKKKRNSSEGNDLGLVPPVKVNMSFPQDESKKKPKQLNNGTNGKRGRLTMEIKSWKHSPTHKTGLCDTKQQRGNSINRVSQS